MIFSSNLRALFALFLMASSSIYGSEPKSRSTSKPAPAKSVRPKPTASAAPANYLLDATEANKQVLLPPAADQKAVTENNVQSNQPRRSFFGSPLRRLNPRVTMQPLRATVQRREPSNRQRNSDAQSAAGSAATTTANVDEHREWLLAQQAMGYDVKIQEEHTPQLAAAQSDWPTMQEDLDAIAKLEKNSQLQNHKPAIQHGAIPGGIAIPTEPVNTKERQEKHKDEQAKQCIICGDDEAAQEDAFVKLSCGHENCCKNCLAGILDTAIGSGSSETLQCPEPNCKINNKRTRLTQADVALITDDKAKLEALNNIQFKEFMAQGQNIKYCPTPDCGFAFIHENSNRQIINCEKCKAPYCANCLLNHDKDSTCEASKAKQALEKVQSKDEKANNEWKKQNTRPCPHCKSPIEKNGGCKWVQCQKCKKDEFCWECLTIQPGHRQHVCVPIPQAEVIIAQENDNSNAKAKPDQRDNNDVPQARIDSWKPGVRCSASLAHHFAHLAPLPIWVTITFNQPVTDEFATEYFQLLTRYNPLKTVKPNRNKQNRNNFIITVQANITQAQIQIILNEVNQAMGQREQQKKHAVDQPAQQQAQLNIQRTREEQARVAARQAVHQKAEQTKEALETQRKIKEAEDHKIQQQRMEAEKTAQIAAQKAQEAQRLAEVNRKAKEAAIRRADEEQRKREFQAQEIQRKAKEAEAAAHLAAQKAQEAQLQEEQKALDARLNELRIRKTQRNAQQTNTIGAASAAATSRRPTRTSRGSSAVSASVIAPGANAQANQARNRASIAASAAVLVNADNASAAAAAPAGAMGLQPFVRANPNPRGRQSTPKPENPSNAPAAAAPVRARASRANNADFVQSADATQITKEINDKLTTASANIEKHLTAIDPNNNFALENVIGIVTEQLLVELGIDPMQLHPNSRRTNREVAAEHAKVRLALLVASDEINPQIANKDQKHLSENVNDLIELPKPAQVPTIKVEVIQKDIDLLNNLVKAVNAKRQLTGNGKDGKPVFDLNSLEAVKQIVSTNKQTKAQEAGLLPGRLAKHIRAFETAKTEAAKTDLVNFVTAITDILNRYKAGQKAPAVIAAPE